MTMVGQLMKIYNVLALVLETEDSETENTGREHLLERQSIQTVTTNVQKNI